MDSAICAECEWSRTVRGPGRILSVGCVQPVRVCGLIVAPSRIPAYGTAVLRIHRDCFADTKTLAGEGVKRTSSKTGRFQLCECQSEADQLRADLSVSRM